MSTIAMQRLELPKLLSNIFFSGSVGVLHARVLYCTKYCVYYYIVLFSLVVRSTPYCVWEPTAYGGVGHDYGRPNCPSSFISWNWHRWPFQDGRHYHLMGREPGECMYKGAGRRRAVRCIRTQDVYCVKKCWINIFARAPTSPSIVFFE